MVCHVGEFLTLRNAVFERSTISSINYLNKMGHGIPGLVGVDWHHPPWENLRMSANDFAVPAVSSQYSTQVRQLCVKDWKICITNMIDKDEMESKICLSIRTAVEGTLAEKSTNLQLAGEEDMYSPGEPFLLLL